MKDDANYLTTYETALAVVATSMKKARQPLDTLMVNSFMGGVLFTSGGMLHVMIQAECPGLMTNNEGIVHLLQGLLYPIGLFYVVLMGVDLFNSNVLFFAVGLARGAVSFIDLLISWIVSWWFNLVGTIFVCYIVCHYSAVSSLEMWIVGSRDVLMTKLTYRFHETLLKGMAGNFFVCLAIYLQLMAKPVHVKLVMMTLPIFTFVALGFTHSVADMFLIVIGLINGARTSVAEVAWKVFLPGALGNIIGGSFFALVIPWYLHIFVVEKDRKKLGLPLYDMRDQQPELNQDSRVVRGAEEEPTSDGADDTVENDNEISPRSSLQYSIKLHAVPAPGLQDNRAHSLKSVASRRKPHLHKSPANVFPVYGMGRAGQRERSIASGTNQQSSESSTINDYTGADERKSATFIGEQLIRTLSRTQSKKDMEAQEIDVSGLRRPSTLSLKFLRRGLTGPSTRLLPSRYPGKPKDGAVSDIPSESILEMSSDDGRRSSEK